MEPTTGYAVDAAWAVLLLVVLLIPLTLWIVTLVSIVRSPNWSPGLKALWALAALPSGLIGMICWFVWGRNDGNSGPARAYPSSFPSYPQQPDQTQQFLPEEPSPRV